MAELSERLRAVPASSARQILSELGVNGVVVQGLRPMTTRERIAGPAATFRFIPKREDLKKPPRGNPARSLFDNFEPGKILVIDGLGFTHCAVLGDMIAARLKARGAAGVIAHGAIRDVEGMIEMGLSVYARGTNPAAPATQLWQWEVEIPVNCGGVFLEPGDYIIADVDAVVVVPKSLAEEVASRGEAMALRDEFSQELLRKGTPLDQAYPLPASREADFEEFKRRR